MMMPLSIPRRCAASRQPRNSKRGGALILSLVAVVVVSMLAATFLQVASSLSRRQSHSVDLKQAMYVAEAGLAEAYIGLGVAKTGNVGTMENPAGFGDGLFWVEATEVAADMVELQSTGMWGAGRVTLGLVVERVEESPGTLGAFSSGDLFVGANSLIDSYDSMAGSYASQALSGANNFGALLGSNGTVTIDGGSNGSEIRGNATPGVGEDVKLHGKTTITGSTSPRAAQVALPAPVVPPVALLPGYVHDDPLPLVLPAGETGFESLRVAADSVVIVQGPGTLVVGELILERDAVLEFDVAAGPLDVYVTDQVIVEPMASITNPSEDPKRVTMQVSASTLGARNVRLESATPLHGTLYAPQSLVQLSAGFELFGAIIAHAMELSGQVRLHIDLAFGSVENNLPMLAAWRVVDIPDAVAQSGKDPFAALGVDKSALLPPKDAHQDQRLVLDYLDASGSARLYDGWESGFDWTDVSAVVSGSRDGTTFTNVAVPTTPPPPLPPPGTISDWIADPTIPSADLKGFLIDASPLDVGELNEAMQRTPPMDPQDLMDLIAANHPLTAGNLNVVIDSAPLSNAQVTTVLLDNTPLKPGDMNNVIENSSLTDAQMRDVLIANCPLPGGIKGTLNQKVPPMNQADKDLVMAVW